MKEIKFPKGVTPGLLEVENLTEVKTGQTFRLRVTPELAGKWLANNHDNRPHSKANFKFLSRQMNEGKWQFNGMSLKFDELGNLVDGQHRLMACVESKTELDTNVSFGVPRDAFYTMDTGKSRTPADVLGAQGYQNSNILAATARQILAIEDGKRGLNEGGLKNTKFDNKDVMDYVRDTPDFQEVVNEAFNLWQKMTIKFVNSNVFCSMYFLFYKKNTNEARAFMESVALGTGLVAGSPALALKRSLEKMYEERSKKRYSLYHKCTVIAKGWNFFRKKRVDIQQLQYRRDEKMQDII